MNTHLLAAAAVVVALGAPVLAVAAPAETDAPQLVVKFADLNTGTPAGQAALHSRINHAATLVCGGRPENLQDVAAGQRFRACMTKAVAAALAKVPAPRMVAGAPNHNG